MLQGGARGREGTRACNSRYLEGREGRRDNKNRMQGDAHVVCLENQFRTCDLSRALAVLLPFLFFSFSLFFFFFFSSGFPARFHSPLDETTLESRNAPTGDVSRAYFRARTLNSSAFLFFRACAILVFRDSREPRASP